MQGLLKVHGAIFRLVVTAWVVTSMLVGCKKAPEPVAEAPVEKKEVPAAPAVEQSLGEFQEDAIVVIGISSFNDLKAFLTTASKAVDDPVDFDKEVLVSIMAEMGLTDSKGVDLDRPFYIVGWNPKKNMGATNLVPLKDKAAFEAALGERKVDSTVGMDFLVKKDFHDLHGLYFGDYVAVSQDLAPVKEHRAFLEKTTQSFKPAETIHLLASMKNFTRIFAVELEQGRTAVLEELTKSLDSSGVMGEAGKIGSIPPSMMTAYANEVDQAVNVIKSIEILDARSKVSEERLMVEVMGQAQPDSILHKFLQKSSERDQHMKSYVLEVWA